MFNKWEAAGQTDQALDFLDESTGDQPQYTFAMENIECTPDMRTRFEFGSDLPDQRKLVQNFNVLYDRGQDPLQLNNLINATEHLGKIWELTQLTYEWCSTFNDPFLSYRRLMDIVGDREDKAPIDLIAGAVDGMD